MVKAQSRIDKTFDWINISILSIILLCVLYPLYFIVISSISDPDAVNAGEVFLVPIEMSFSGYERIFQDDTLWRGYKNSILYTVLSTVTSLALVLTGSYALSRKDLLGRNFMMFAIVFTMFFQGGLIPTYLLVKDLGMINTMWALFIPNMVGVYHIIVTRTFFQSTIPHELLEAAKVDGCSNTKFFFRIVLPLSMPIIAVMTLFNAVREWNSYFPALIYLRDESLYPLQIVLRNILISSKVTEDMMLGTDEDELAEMRRAADMIKFGVIIVASVPVLIMYPFVQRYFVKGVMIGSIKG